MATTVTTSSPGMSAEEQQFFQQLLGPLAQQQGFQNQLQQAYQPMAQLGGQLTTQAAGQLGSFQPGQLGALSGSETAAIRAIGDAMRSAGNLGISRAEEQGTQAWQAQTARMGLLPTDTPPQQRFGNFQAELLRQRSDLEKQASGWEGTQTLEQQRRRATENQAALAQLLGGSKDIFGAGTQLAGAQSQFMQQLAAILYALGRNRGGTETRTTKEPWYQTLTSILGPVASMTQAGTGLAQWLYEIFGPTKTPTALGPAGPPYSMPWEAGMSGFGPPAGSFGGAASLFPTGMGIGEEAMGLTGALGGGGFGAGLAGANVGAGLTPAVVEAMTGLSTGAGTGMTVGGAGAGASVGAGLSNLALPAALVAAIPFLGQLIEGPDTYDQDMAQYIAALQADPARLAAVRGQARSYPQSTFEQMIQNPQNVNVGTGLQFEKSLDPRGYSDAFAGTALRRMGFGADLAGIDRGLSEVDRAIQEWDRFRDRP